MSGTPSTVLSLGLGSWSTVNLLVTLGFGIGTVAPVSAARPKVELTWKAETPVLMWSNPAPVVLTWTEWPS